MATKTNIAKEIAKKAGVTQEKATQMLDAFFDFMCECLQNGEKIQLTGYLSVESVHKPAHEGRNPQTGAVVKVPARNRVVIKAGKCLKEACNK